MNNNKIKVLIGDDTAEYGVKIASQLRELGVYAYTRRRDGAVLLDSIIRDKPDVVVTDLTLQDSDSILLMEQSKNLMKDLPAFIIISDIRNNYIERQVIESGASYYLVSPFENDTLCSVIKSVAKKPVNPNCTDIEILVTDIIHKFGVPAHIKGYHYLRSAILKSATNERILDSITKQLYPYVAKEYQTTPSRVERAIRHAIETAWDRGGADVINSYFGCNSDSYRGRPTNSEFIALVSDRVRLQIKMNNKNINM
ncbi:MAG: sporulation transcription factor Spo0A [Clostridiales bacterium]|nr:sporulation transcription factor Spo0A [Clostridiales bacterium]MCM1435668.1 sporulation transcription factor Spo0A [Ruminococcus flavefaciens]